MLLTLVRSLSAAGLSLLAVLAFAATASAQTPVGGLQQLPPPNDCISTQGGDTPECGTVIAGGTTDAVSIAVTPDGENAYVASSGGTNPGSLATFTRNESTGELSFNACVRDPSSAETCATELTQLQGASYVVATNEHVYVASSGSDAVRGFTRNQTTGALTPIAAGSGGCVQAIGAGGCTDGDNGLNGVEYLVLSPDGEFLYAISEESGTIVVLDRNPATGALTNSTSVAQAGVRAADISADGNDLYAVSPTQHVLVHYDRDPATGVLTRNECFRGTLGSPLACGNTPTGQTNGINGAYDVEVVTTGTESNVYVVGRAQTLAQGSTLATFDRDTGDGTLTFSDCLRDNEATGPGETACDPANGLLDATSITARPDGAFLYVTGNDDNAISYFRRDVATGVVTQLAGANDRCVSDGDAECGADNDTEGLTGVNETAVDPEGRFLYSTADGDDAVAEFAIQYAPVCPDVTRDDVPAQTTVDITPTCTDLNQPRDVLTIEARDQPPAGEGTVTAVDTNNDGRADTLRYDPGTFIGTTTFTYVAEDDQGNESPEATVTVTVLASGAPVISVSDAAASEGESLAFTFQRTGPTTERITVFYSTENDTATAPDDFPAQTNQSVVFEAGETSKTVNIIANDDNIDEETERFRVRITNAVEDAGPTPAISDALGIGTIADNDTSIASIGDTTVGEAGGTATLTVTLSNPSSRTVTVQYDTNEGTATDPEDFTDSSGTVSFAPGDTSETISIPIVNDVITEQTEQFTVALTAPTGGASLGDASGQVTITDNDVPAVSISDAEVVEGDTGSRNATFDVTLSAPTSQTVTVQYATANGTATAGSDYTTTNGTLTFTAGQVSRTVDVPVSGDVVQEPDETFTVTLSAPSNATVADGTGTGTIRNDDRDPSVSISDASIDEGNADARDMAFTVTLSEAAPGPVTVAYATSDGTATAGTDYDARNGTVTFAAGDTTETVNVPVRGDTAVEGDETFTVTLSGPTASSIGDGSGTGRILNDDQPAQQQPAPRTTVVVGDTGISEGDGGTRAVTFTVALSQAATGPVSVDVATAPGTALDGQDFRGGNGRITFAAGQTTQAVPIQVIGDTTPEADEQFTLRLTNASGADIAKDTGTATIANDDITRRRPGLTFTVTPKRDLTLPHVFRVVGRVVLPSGVSAEEGCGSGRVSAQYKNGGNTISTRRATLDAQCRFTIRTPFNIRSRLRNARRLKLTVRFQGNRYLSARSAQPVFVRVRR